MLKNDRRVGTLNQCQDGFRCLHCDVFITCNPAISGVRNRNHCPYCLRSRHMDLFEAGDRLAACKSQMEPLGLTFKRSRNKYAHQEYGELMLIHRCDGCGEISINRIAADDVVEAILEVYEASLKLGHHIRTLLKHNGVRILQVEEYECVIRQLLGSDHIVRIEIRGSESETGFSKTIAYGRRACRYP